MSATLVSAVGWSSSLKEVRGEIRPCKDERPLNIAKKKEKRVLGIIVTLHHYKILGESGANGGSGKARPQGGRKRE